MAQDISDQQITAHTQGFFLIGASSWALAGLHVPDQLALTWFVLINRPCTLMVSSRDTYHKVKTQKGFGPRLPTERLPCLEYRQIEAFYLFSASVSSRWQLNLT